MPYNWLLATVCDSEVKYDKQNKETPCYDFVCTLGGTSKPPFFIYVYIEFFQYY